jgi:hypothetical protein
MLWIKVSPLLLCCLCGVLVLKPFWKNEVVSLRWVLANVGGFCQCESSILELCLGLGFQYMHLAIILVLWEIGWVSL